jgi:hypothetical protein
MIETIGGKQRDFYKPARARLYDYLYRVDFYENGAIQSTPPENDGKNRVIGKGKETVFKGHVIFHDNGVCKEGTLAGAHAFTIGTGIHARNLRFQWGEKIVFYKNGAVKCGTVLPDEQIPVNGVLERISWEGCKASFYESGELLSMGVDSRSQSMRNRPPFIYRGRPITGLTFITASTEFVFGDYRKGVVESFNVDLTNPRQRAYFLNLGMDITTAADTRKALVRFTDADLQKVESFNFDHDTWIEVNGKKINCRADQWATLE